MTNKIFLLTLFALCIHTFVYAQSSTAAQLSSDSGKIEFFIQSRSDTPNYSKACRILSNQVKENPTDAELRYFLGYALDRLNSNDGKTIPSIQKQQTILASEQFEKVNSLQPTYLGEKALLDPYSKLTAIWGSLAMAYLNHHQNDSAKWAFNQGKVRGGFIEPFLKFNRDMLQQCDKNSILITSGDNITIPIWYLQTIENYRNDVIVIDVNLLNAAWYPKYLKHAKKLNLTLSDEEIDSLTYITWQPDSISIVNPINSRQSFTWLLPPSYLGEYLLCGDLLLLDILKNNFFSHSIYFSLESQSSYNLALDKHLKNRGMVQQIDHDTIIHDDESKKFNVMINSLTIKDIRAEDIIHSDDALKMMNYYRYIYYKHAYEYYNQGNMREAKACMDNMDIHFPPSMLPYESELQEKSYADFHQYLNSQVE